MERIWTFKANERVQCPDIEPKQFKSTTNFYEDVEMLCKNLQIKVHPALKKPVKPQSVESSARTEEKKEEESKKEHNQLIFNKHRLDKNSMKVLFFLLPFYPTFHTLK